MSSALTVLGWRILDLYLLATVLLLGAIAIMTIVRQPARRLCTARAGLLGLTLLVGAAAIPTWPRISLERAWGAALSRVLPPDGAGEATASAAADDRGESLADAARRQRPARLAADVTFDPQSAWSRAAASGTGAASRRWLADEVLAGFTSSFLIGSIGVWLWLAYGAWRAARLAARATSAPSWLQAELDGWARSAVRLRVSEELTSPVAMGVFRPTIILPSALVHAGCGAPLRAVLAHEWAHIRHGDLTVLAVSRGLWPLFFAHPLYWWLRRMIREDHELLADAAAVADSGLAQDDYAEVLVCWARGGRGPIPSAAAALGIWERPSQLTRRIAMLLDEHVRVEASSSRPWRYGSAVVAGLLAVALSILTLADGRPARADGSAPAVQLGATPLARLRSPASRANLVKIGGGTEATERAVDAALGWLARHQAPNGSWGLGQFRKQCQDQACTSVDRGDQQELETAATAMGLLPLLAAGHSHQTEGPYQKAVQKGLKWLLQQQQPDGSWSKDGLGMMYAHGLATLVLCDAYALTADKSIGAAAQKAVQFIEQAQDPDSGGWRYVPRQGGDTSVFGWQLAALRTAQLGGLKVEPTTLQGAQKWLATAEAKPGAGKYGYIPGAAPTVSMTAVGLLSRCSLGSPPPDPARREGVQFVLQGLPTAGSNVYALYYATQALHQMAGQDWEKWNAATRELLVKNQIADKSCAAGSWNPQRDMWGQQGGRLMVTSFICLSLEVYYRYPRPAP